MEGYKLTYHVDMVFCIDATGSMRHVLDLVKQGILVIVEHAALNLTLAQMRTAVEKAQGYALPEKVDEDKLVNMYHLLCS